MTPRSFQLLGIAVAVLVAAGGCQGYQFDPVAPKAIVTKTQDVPITGTKKAPNVVVVVDKSGSMEEPAGGSCSAASPVCCSTSGQVGTYCPPGGGPATCNNSCKWNDMLDAMTNPSTGFLIQAAGKARFALAAFPDDNACKPPGDFAVKPLADNNAALVVNAIKAMTPGGGTPTARALQLAGTLSGLVDPERDAYVLLITDGLPNCNDANSGKCDTCTNDPGRCTSQVQPDGTTQYCNNTGTGSCAAGLLCLDGGPTVQAIKDLAAKGVKTFVIGFGTAGATADSDVVLNAMAVAGKMDDNGKYYSARDRAQLKKILDAFAVVFETCSYSLSEQPEAGMLVVKRFESGSEVATKTLALGTDYAVAGTSVTVIGAECDLLKNSRPGQWTLRFSYARTL